MILWNYLYIFEMNNLSVRYNLEILKCRVSLERLFKSGESLEDYKGCFEPKIQEDELEL